VSGGLTRILLNECVLSVVHVLCCVCVFGQIKNVGMHRAGYHYLLASIVSSRYFTVCTYTLNFMHT